MSTRPLNIVFAGTPDFAAQHLAALLSQNDHRVIAVYTQPDRPAGRGKHLQASPVKTLAMLSGIPVYQPESFKTADAQATLAALKPDVMIVVAYGLLLPQTVLDIPTLGCINVHGSILPRWRGAAPIQRAIEAGDPETGVTIMQMNAGLDTGPMLHIARCPIDAHETSATLYEKLAKLGPPALQHTLHLMAEGQAVATEQDNALATYAKKIDKSEAQIDWSQPAAIIAQRIRAFNPAPVAYTTLNGERIKIWQAHHDASSTLTGAPGEILRADKHGLIIGTGEGAVTITLMQMQNGKALAISDILNGHAARLTIGTVLGQ